MWIDHKKQERLLKLLVYGYSEAANDFLVHMAREVRAPNSHDLKQGHRGAATLDVTIGTFHKLKTDIRLVAVPDNPVSRKLIVRHSDGVVFIADPRRVEESRELLLELQQNLTLCGYSIDSFPCLILLDARGGDDGKVADVTICATLGVEQDRCVGVDSTKGTGVVDALKKIVKLMLSSISKEEKAD